MFSACFATMDYAVDSNIIIIRGANDILNPAYLSPINDGEGEFPSVEHYCLCQIVLRAGMVGEVKEVLNSPNARSGWKFVRNVIVNRFASDDLERADYYLNDVRDECLLNGLRLRMRQDHSFLRALLDTRRALLAHCDVEDYIYGLGMDEKSFLKWVESNGLTTETLLNWFRRYDLCPCQDVVGRNKLGLILMDIRAEELDRRRRSPPLAPPPAKVLPPISRMNQQQLPSLASLATFAPPVATASQSSDASVAPPAVIHSMGSTAPSLPSKQLSKVEIEEITYQRYVIPGQDDEEGDWVVSDQILALEGPLAVLSQYYPTPFITRKRRYRSVEHYAYQKLFKKLKLGRKAIEKLVTTPDPSKLSGLARRLLQQRRSSNTRKRVAGSGLRNEEDEEGTSAARVGSVTEKGGGISKNDFYDHLLKYYERATKLKFEQYPVLKRLLMATGDALLIETCPVNDRRAAFEWTICLQEADCQHFLTSSQYNTGDLLRLLLKPEKKLLSYFPGILGRNRAGLALMRLRLQYLHANVEPLHLPPPPPTGGELDENRLICFTNTSVLHPSYVSPFWTKEGDLYPSVQHFISLEAARKFEFPDWVRRQLADSNATDVGYLLMWHIYQLFPDPERCLEWFWTGGRDEMFKIGSRLKFEKHPDLLRALLETGSSLLIYCKDRFQSEDSEWSVACVEPDLKQWMHECGYDCRSLLKLCLSAPEKRPAFLGGNRLGALLMELRREFRLRGFQPHTLPKMGLPLEVVLGTGDEGGTSGIEGKGFSADAVWPSPHFLLCKKRGQPILDRPNKKRKLHEHSSLVPEKFFGATPSHQPSPAAVVAAMGGEQLQQTAVMLLSKLSAMRKETESENGTLRQLLDSLTEIRDRTPQLDHPAVSNVAPHNDKAASTGPTPTETASASIPPVSEQKQKWAAFEEGLSSTLRKTAVKKEEKTTDADEDTSLFDPKNWDETRVRPLVDCVWPHLTIRERQTALEWLWYTIGKLDNLKKVQQSMEQKRLHDSSIVGVAASSLVPREKSETMWVMPQVKVIMTQKSNEASESAAGGRAGTPQSEGTTVHAIKYKVDWVIPAAGVYPKIVRPLSP